MSNNENYSQKFKNKLVSEVINSNKTLVEIANMHNVKPEHLEKWYQDSIKHSKSNRYQNYSLILGLFVLLGIAICLIIGCFATTAKETHQPKSAPKATFGEFTKTWNKKVYKIKYANNHLNINFDKYELNGDVLNQLDTYLKYDKNKYIALKKRLQGSDYSLKYMPIVLWIDAKLEVKYLDKKNITNDSQLTEHVASIINPKTWFSDKTIDTVIQLNEFCYYFEKNKDKLHNNGYTKNIKSCKKIQEILDRDNLPLKLK